MATRTGLFEIIANGKNSGVEFKRDVLQAHDLAKELVAFSNLEGGMVLLGVDDDGTILGLTRNRLKEWVMDVCRDKIRPPIIPFFEMVEDLRPGADIAVVRVPRSASIHCHWHRNVHTYYVRVGSRSREAEPEELAWLFQQRRTIRADVQAVSGSTIDDLDRRRLVDYFTRVREQDVPDDDDRAGWRTLLVDTGIMAEEGVSLSGMLLFGTVPNRFLPQAGINAAAFPGQEKDHAAKESYVLRGPLVPLMDKRGEIIEAGLVEQALEFVKRNTTVTARLEGGSRRTERRLYPDEVIRETVVNALIHRDYLLAYTDIELAVYMDRLEVASPGKLPNDVTPERMRVGVRAARNRLLQDVMWHYGYVEHMGMGVSRTIVRGMKDHNGTDPALIVDGERFVVRLFA